MIINAKLGGSSKAFIVVTAPTGSTVTCDSVAGTEVSGTWTFSVALGTHTIVATKDSSSKTESVLVDAVAVYAITITYSRLPSGFQEVEYIEGTGSQWIDFDYQPTISTKSVLDITFTQYSASLIWGFCASDSNDYRFFNKAGGTTSYDGCCFWDIGSARTQYLTKYFSLARYQLEFGNFYVRDLSTSQDITSGSTQSSVPTGSITLFYSANDSAIACGILWSAQICEGSTTQRNLVPCYCTTTVTGYKGSTAVSCASGTVGLYDLVDSKFFVNCGSGTDFTKGDDV